MGARIPIEDRFWPKVEVTGCCWLWTASKIEGYGQISAGGVGGGVVLAHRWAYEHLVGPIPEGKVLDHICRVRHCVNPDHLIVTTHRENILAGYGPTAEQARRGTCRFGHPLDMIDNGKRRCRTCRNAWYRERYRRRKEG